MTRSMLHNSLTNLRWLLSLGLILLAAACSLPSGLRPAATQTTPTAAPASASEGPTSGGLTGEAVAPPTPTPLPTTVPLPVPTEARLPLEIPVTGLCGTGTLDLLALGLGTHKADGSGGADAIRLVHADFEARLIRVLALPPGLWADTPALNAAGVAAAPLAQVYVHAKAQAATAGAAEPRELTGQAARVLAETLKANYGFAPARYLVVDPAGFTRMVDALGGVELDLPAGIEAAGDEIEKFDPGLQRLDGGRAFDYARLLAEGGEAERIERQNRLLRALLGETIQPANWLKIPGMLDELSSAVTTDLGGEEITRLVCLSQQAGGTAPLLELPAGATSSDAEGRLLAEDAEVRRLVEALVAAP